MVQFRAFSGVPVGDLYEEPVPAGKSKSRLQRAGFRKLEKSGVS